LRSVPRRQDRDAEMTNREYPPGAELPIGRPVDSKPAARPQRIRLEGRFVTLMPLEAATHSDAMFDSASAAEREALWLYLPDEPAPDRDTFRAYVERKAASEDPLFYAVVDKASGRAVGHASLLRIDTANRTIEVGYILYTPALQRTPGATEAMYLLATYVFDELGYRRYEWKCNDLNAPSKHAAVRLGFSFEGVFRHHMIVKGRNRDTAWFAMLDSEWPRRKAAFLRWLAPENFDAQGRQILALSALNGVGSS
jgi:RimJ/RimL family protein N-acetyltransferase